MKLSAKLDRLHFNARKNIWLGYFAIFNRIALAAGFIPSGLQKILGERFTVLPVNHPMGHYLDAFYHTGYYYTSVGIMQVTAAILLLIPRTATLGAFLYFPIILNICILSLSVRFDGSLFTAPLMVFANLFLLCWDYHKFKFIFPFNRSSAKQVLPKKDELSKKFPLAFFSGVAIIAIMVVLHSQFGYKILPHNTSKDCNTQCEDSPNPTACFEFCKCIHDEGQPLYKCLDQFHKSDESNSESN